MSLRRLSPLLFAVAFCLAAFAPSSASASTDLVLGIHHAPTNFIQGQEGEFWFDIHNVGDTPSSGPITVKVGLSKGITRKAVRLNVDPVGGLGWSCPGSAGDSVITCTVSGSIPRHYTSLGLRIAVNVSAASGEVTASAKLEGGGDPTATSASEFAPIRSEEAEPGFGPKSFEPDFYAPDGTTPVRESGAHPEYFVVPFDTNLLREPTDEAPEQTTVADRTHRLEVNTPPGFVGAPTAVGECSQADFTVNKCPISSMVGRIDFHIYPISSGTPQVFAHLYAQVYNLAHPRGTVSDLGFSILANPVHIKVSLDPANHYSILSRVEGINETLPIFDQRLTLWGVPAAHSHDSERCQAASAFTEISTDKECATDLPAKPFLTVPPDCGTSHVMRLHHYDFWESIGVFGPEIDYTQPGETTDCDKPRFEPDVEAVTTGKQANTPTGLDVHIKVNQNESPNALSTPPVKRTTVTLPEGMSFSPSFADGLEGCTLAQMQLGTNNPVQCPDASRIGEVTLHTSLLPRAAEGSMYLAAQGDNPFGSTFALLLVLEDTEERGVLIKIPGRLDVDPNTGQIVTVFDDLPQFPFDDMTLKFRSGPRAPLVSPPTCGKQTIGIEVASYAQPQNPVDASNTYQVTEGPNGTPCPPESARRPFHPDFSAGTLNPVAGAYSTFLFRMSRSDDEQELSQVSTTLPPGLVARIAGTSLCPDAAINSISTALGSGRAELNNPACPASSFFGTVSAGLGAGPGPNYFPGRVYLAGPYKGAPLSLAVVAPGLAGPYDLGNVVVRAALYVDPDTAQVKAVSDPFPTVLHGVILRVRDVRLRIDRPQTTINPTSCQKMAVGGEITGVGGSLQSTADDSLFRTAFPFQVGSCADLAFKPKLDLRLFGGTKRGAHPKFQATLTMPPGGANIASASVALPRSEFLDQGHIKTICTRVQFAAEACPAGSIYGKVSAKTPLLEETLSANVYLRSSSHKLPDLVAAFRGGRIDANLVGRIDSVNGGIRNSFEVVPDVPVTSATFTFAGGAKGLLVNSRNICAGEFRATAEFTAQNGATKNWRPKLGAKCAKAAKRPHKPKR
jgi:hypothetical protein